MAYAIQHARSLPGSDCLPTQAQFVLDFVNDVRAFGDTPWSEWKKRWRFYGKQIPDWWLREIQDRTREDLRRIKAGTAALSQLLLHRSLLKRLSLRLDLLTRRYPISMERTS